MSEPVATLISSTGDSVTVHGPGGTDTVLPVAVWQLPDAPSGGRGGGRAVRSSSPISTGRTSPRRSSRDGPAPPCWSAAPVPSPRQVTHELMTPCTVNSRWMVHDAIRTTRN